MLETMGVTIGIPLFNEVEFIAQAIHSAAKQCDVLIVSDNCSDDGSSEICLELAKVYTHLKYIRHDNNLGAAKNFEYILKASNTKYFMWLGAHDLISDNYIKRLKLNLESDQEAVLAFGSSTHIDKSGLTVSTYDYFYSKQLSANSPIDRLMAIIRYLSDCSLIHGLFLRQALTTSWEDFNYLASDHVLIAKLAISGKFNYLSDVAFLRRDIRDDGNLSKQLERITGKRSNSVKLEKTKMQTNQFNLLKSYSEQAGLSKWILVKGRFWLVLRYGSFSDHKFLAAAENFLFMLFNIFRIRSFLISR